MKGIVFTEFLEMVEQRWGLDVVDGMLAAAGSDGVYAGLGNYPHEEMWRLVEALSQGRELPSSQLLEDFGMHLCASFSMRFPQYFQARNCFGFLMNVDTYIAREVRALYPDAELPRITVVEHSDATLTLRYVSQRCMSDVALGLIRGAILYFDEPLVCERLGSDDTGSDVTMQVRVRG